MNTKNEVVVTANELGSIVIPSINNPEYGYIRVEQSTVEIINGWLTPKTRSAIISGKTEHLQAMNFKKGSTLPGRIQIVESIDTPSVPNPEKFLKLSGTNGIPCKINGDAIFRVASYDPTNKSEDIFIQHDNKEEIKAAQAKLATAGVNLNK